MTSGDSGEVSSAVACCVPERRLITRVCVDMAATTTGELIITGAADELELAAPGVDRGEKLQRGAMTGRDCPKAMAQPEWHRASVSKRSTQQFLASCLCACVRVGAGGRACLDAIFFRCFAWQRCFQRRAKRSRSLAPGASTVPGRPRLCVGL